MSVLHLEEERYCLGDHLWNHIRDNVDRVLGVVFILTATDAGRLATEQTVDLLETTWQLADELVQPWDLFFKFNFTLQQSLDLRSGIL